MPKIRDRAGPGNEKDILKQIEYPLSVVQNGWRDITHTPEGLSATISKANELVSLQELLSRHINLENVSSSSGWSLRAICPFHKGGHERTASFYINPEYNRFYCQACSASGSVVEFVSMKYKRAPVLVAEHIMNIVNGNIKVDHDRISKIKEKERFEASLLLLSEMCRNFSAQHMDDDDAIMYMNRLMSGFDSFYKKNPEAVTKTMSNVLMHFEMYFSKYDKESNENVDNT